jgi:hypothetical protein
MTRKDSEKESERPHYYSQFWLDIAAGRRTIGGPKPEDEGELLDDAPEPISLRRPLRNEPDEDLDEDEPTTTRRTTATRTVAPVVSPDEEDVEEEPEEEPLVTDEGEDFSQDEDIADADIPDMDLAADEDVEDADEDVEDADEELFEDEDEDEEEEGWVAGRGRKKPSPKRPTKQPPVKRPKRDTRRSF